MSQLYSCCPYCGEDAFRLVFHPNVRCVACGEVYQTTKPLKTPTRERKADRKRA